MERLVSRRTAAWRRPNDGRVDVVLLTVEDGRRCVRHRRDECNGRVPNERETGAARQN